MGHSFNSTGIKPTRGGYVLLPAGIYCLEIIRYKEGESEKKDYKVNLEANIIYPNKVEDLVVFGVTLKHTVTFMPPTNKKGEVNKGAGMAIHFLKTIGEPWEESDELDIEPSRWIGKRFIAKIEPDDWETPEGKVIKLNKIRWLDVIPADMLPKLPEEGIPF